MGMEFVYSEEDELIKILSKGDQLPYEVIDFDEYLKEDRLKLLIVCKPETMPAVIERAKTFKNERFKCASLQTTQHLFEFMDPRISKSFGLQKLMEMHGFTMENLCTFGDADNDYDMTLHAGVGVVMANGSEKTKSVADHITKDNDHDGIGVFLQEHLISDHKNLWIKNIKRTYIKSKEKPITEIMQKMLTIKICGCII